MPKARANLSVDGEVLARFDRMVQNRSEAVEEFMRKKADMEVTENEELVKRRETINDKLEEKRDERDALENEIDNLETELNAIRSTLEKAKEEKDVLGDALPVLIDKFEELRRKKHDKSEALKMLGTTETFHMWLERMDDLDSDDLKDKIREEVEE